MNWHDRIAYNSGGFSTIDWENCKLYEEHGSVYSVDWQDGVLYKPTSGTESLNWRVGYAKDPSGGGTTVNWNTGQLWSDSNTRVLNWKLKKLIGDW